MDSNRKTNLPKDQRPSRVPWIAAGVALAVLLLASAVQRARPAEMTPDPADTKLARQFMEICQLNMTGLMVADRMVRETGKDMTPLEIGEVLRAVEERKNSLPQVRSIMDSTPLTVTCGRILVQMLTETGNLTPVPN